MATSASLVHIVDSRTPSTSGLYNAVLILVSAAFLGFTIGAAALVLSKNNKCMVREDVAEKGLAQTGMAAEVLAASSEVTPISKPGGTSASGSAPAQEPKSEDTKSEGETKETPKPAETETDEKPAETETDEKPAETETDEKPVETSEDDKSETEGTLSERTGGESESEEGEEGEGVKAEGDGDEPAEGDVELTEGNDEPAEGGAAEQTHEEDILTETAQDHTQVETTEGAHTADDPNAEADQAAHGETIEVKRSDYSEA